MVKWVSPRKRRITAASEQEHQPGRENDQAGGEGDQAEGVLADAENRGEQAHAAGGLAAGAVELVVEDGIFEARPDRGGRRAP